MSLPADYAGLSSQALLDRLAADQRFDVLQAFWRYSDAAICSALVDPILRTGAAQLVDLLVSEILEPTITEPLPTRLIEGLRNRRPSLPQPVVARLATRLREPEPLVGAQYENSRGLLEIWVIGQDDKVADDFAIDVIRGETPRSHEDTVRQAAYARCGLSPDALTRACSVLASEMDGSPSPEVWQKTSNFVEVVCAGQTSPPASVVPIIEKLIEQAPTCAPAESLGPQLARCAAATSWRVLERVIGGRLTDSPGARALLRTIPQVSHPGTRTRLFTRATRRQPHMWTVLQPQTASWDEATWKRALKAVIGEERLEPGVLAQLLNGAPSTISAGIVELALSQAENPGDPPHQVAGQRLRQRLDEVGSEPGTEPDWVEACYWPRTSDEAALAKLASLLEFLEAEDHVRIVVLAFLAGKAAPAAAARLFREGASYEALRECDDDQNRAVLARALVGVRSEEATEAVCRLQSERFSLEVAQAFARTDPDCAFSGAADAFPSLGPADRDALVDLLAEHSTANQAPVLEAIISDDHRENNTRRAKAARRIAELLPTGEPPPRCVTDLLGSNVPNLRETGVHAIKTIRPRDPELLGRLHEVVTRGGDPGRAAAEALDALADQFIGEMQMASSKEEARELIPLLGAVGRPQVLSQLFKYLGANAEYDDATMHRAAAEAVQQAAQHVESVDEETQTVLVGLVDGEEREADPDAQAALSTALARIQLGEDAALQILYDVLDFKVRAAADELFGPEKDRLVRQLALYARARDRGQAGWGLAIVHLDNVAERLVRAAYLACADGSEAIKEQIRSDPGKPDYGKLIGALSSAKLLQGVQGECRVLHKIRSQRSEVPHTGEEPDDETITTAQRSMKEIAKVCVGLLMQRVREGGG
jgi:hypothetical protein